VRPRASARVEQDDGEGADERVEGVHDDVLDGRDA